MATNKTVKKKSVHSSSGKGARAAKKPTKKQRKKKAKKLLGIDDFQTRGRANKGFRLNLLSAEGQDTDHYLDIIGLDSDAFIAAKKAQSSRITELAAIESKEEKEDLSIEYFCEFLASVVTGWSFDDPEITAAASLTEFNPENVARFFREAPQIRDQVEKIVSRRSLFFRMQAASVQNTQSDSST